METQLKELQKKQNITADNSDTASIPTSVSEPAQPVDILCSVHTPKEESKKLDNMDKGKSDQSINSNESVVSVRSSKRASKTPSKYADFTSHKSPKLTIKLKDEEDSVDPAPAEEVQSSTPKELDDSNLKSPIRNTIIIKRSPIQSIVITNQRISPPLPNQAVPTSKQIKVMPETRKSQPVESTKPQITQEVRRMSTDASQRYKCDECDKNFKKKSHLDEHMLIHAGEKPFKCEKCGWSFRRKDKMKKHMESCNYVNRESEFSAFLRPGKRRSSTGVTKIVQGILTANSGSSRWQTGVYICTVCQKDCGYKQNLLFHMKRHEKYGETNNFRRFYI